jgi:hypothetical protein
MRVHSTLGNGFQEVIYQRALALEMEAAGLNFEREKSISIYYRGKDIVTRRVDFFVEDYSGRYLLMRGIVIYYWVVENIKCEIKLFLNSSYKS